MDDEPKIPPHFGRAAWSYAWRDFKLGLHARSRVITEALLGYAFAYRALIAFGSDDAPSDMTAERLLALPLAAVAAMLLHGLWSWASAPRRIFDDQQRMIAVQDEKLAERQSLTQKRDTLAAFIQHGNRLRARKTENPLPVGDAEQWLKELLDYLRENFGQSYAVRVCDGTGYPPYVFPGSVEANNFDRNLGVRIWRLHEFLREI